MIQEWVKQVQLNAKKAGSGNNPNSAKTGNGNANPLTYLEKVDKWTVTESAEGAEVWSEVWGIVNDLESLRSSESAEGGVKKYKGQNMWLESLTPKKATYLTTVFITPKFFTFNAAAYKNFAVTLSSSMKRVGGEGFLVVFHPEYVGGEKEERRAPFPMVAVCREVKDN